MNAYMVEDCFELTPKKALRGLGRVKKIGGKTSDTQSLDIDYWLDPNNPDVLSVSVKGHEPQKLVLEWLDITYGKIAYFNCNCGYRAAKLYLTPDGTQFKCRVCQKLKYRLASINPGSVAGVAIYRLNRMSKLAETRAKMGRIFYNGKYTKRFNRFLKLCNNLGLKNVVEDARGLLEVIKSQEILTNAVY